MSSNLEGGAPGKFSQKLEIDPIAFEDAFIYGYTGDFKKRKGMLLPQIANEIEDRAGNSPANMDWKYKLLERHGFEKEELLELKKLPNLLINFILLILSGLTTSGSLSEAEALGYVHHYENFLKLKNKKLKLKIEEKILARRKFFLEKRGRGIDRNIDRYLATIEKELGIKPVEIFNEGNIPRYFKRNQSPASKSGSAYRSLEEVLREIALAASGYSPNEIASKTRRVARDISFFIFGTGSSINMLNPKLINIIRKKHNLPDV